MSAEIIKNMIISSVGRIILRVFFEVAALHYWYEIAIAL